VWTGSCPCQPFSAGGQQKGFNDERHLWPHFRRLIAERRPSVIFGEQVASKLGRKWLASLRLDLEALDYAVGGADLCAAGLCAPHIRQRLYWVADSASSGLEGVYEAIRGIDMQSTITALRSQWDAEPKMDRVAYGIPAKVGRLCGFGNSIVPQIGAVFVRSCMEAVNQPVISCHICGDVTSINTACPSCGEVCTA
jgi:site-specific DNA-cytosine methylase